MSIRAALLAIACTTFVAGSALAQEKGKGRDNACVPDAKKLCQGVRPGGGRVNKCLTDHESELSPACRDLLAQAKARYEEFVKACKADGEKYCKGIKPGGGRILSCLKGRESDLTPECKAEFNRAKNDTTNAR